MAPHHPLLRRIALPHEPVVPRSCPACRRALFVEDARPKHGAPGENRAGLSISLVDRIERPRPTVPARPKPTKTGDGPFFPIDVQSEVVEQAVVSTSDHGRVEGPGRGSATVVGRPGSHGMGRGLLPVPASVQRVVYLVDRSVSMGPSGALATARQEIAASLLSLSPHTLFQVIPYNKVAEPLELDGKRELAEADPATVEAAIEQLEAIQPSGATDSAQALCRALQFHPEVIFLLTDADDLTPARMTSLFRHTQVRAVLHVFELSRARPDQAVGSLEQLARGTGGTYQRIVPGR